ncbi:MAG: lysophospholipid acyltransferase family protein [Paludibacteraceae bacterium]|nr:lysophospholipid acyltransferase family protein [Paludibacteraceae bacterium]
MIRIFSLLPLSVLYMISDVMLYPLMYYIARYRLKVVRKNLRNSFPDKSHDELKNIEKKFYHHFADLIAEVVYGYRVGEEEMRERVVFENVDLVEDLASKTHGVIAYLGHMGNWEWLVDLNKRFVNPAMVEYNVYRQLKNPASDKMMLELRSKRGGECIEKNQLLRKLVMLRRADHLFVIGMLSDQKPSKRSSYAWTQFLNQETAFLDGSEVLAHKFGFSAVYAHIWSTKRGYYRIRFEQITDDPSKMQPKEMTKRYAELLEQNIYAQPEQWLWTHNRWKWGRKELEG